MEEEAGPPEKTNGEGNVRNGGDNGAAAVPPPTSPANSSPPGVSPPGMRLRSGRKKRRRSGGGAAADGGGGQRTPSDGKKPAAARKSARKRRVAVETVEEEDSEEDEDEEEEAGRVAKKRRGDDGDRDNDEEMDDAADATAGDHDEEMDDAAAEEDDDDGGGKMPPAAADAAAAAVSMLSPPADRAALAEAAGASPAAADAAAAAADDAVGLPPVSLQLPSQRPPPAAAGMSGAYTGMRRLVLRAPALGRPSTSPSNGDDDRREGVVPAAAGAGVRAGSRGTADSNGMLSGMSGESTPIELEFLPAAAGAAGAAAAAVAAGAEAAVAEAADLASAPSAESRGDHETTESPSHLSGRRDPTIRRLLRRASSLFEGGRAASSSLLEAAGTAAATAAATAAGTAAASVGGGVSAMNAHLVTFTETIRATGAGTIVVPEVERPSPGQASKDEDDEARERAEADGEGMNGEEKVGAEEEGGEERTAAAAARESTDADKDGGGPLHSRTLPWLILFLVLHLTVSVMMDGGQRAGGSLAPLWRSVPETGARRLEWYRSLLGYETDVVGSMMGGEGSNDTTTASLTALEEEEEEVESEEEEEEEEEEEDEEEEEIEEVIIEVDGPEIEPEVIEEVVEEIVVEIVPDPDLLERERTVRKDRVLIERYSKDQEVRLERRMRNSALVEGAFERHQDDSGINEEVLDGRGKELEGLIARADEVVGRRRRELEEWEAALVEAERAVEELAAGEERRDDGDDDAAAEEGESVSSRSERKVAAVESLEALASATFVPILASVFDADEVQIPGEGCHSMDYVLPPPKTEEEIEVEPVVEEDEDEDEEDAPLARAELEQARAELTELADSTARSLMEEEGLVSVVKVWAAEQVRAIGLVPSERTAEDDEEEEAAAVAEDALVISGDIMTAEDVQAVIDARLEAEMADGTGRLDLASIRAGAAVVRTGPRRTSRSLVDNLPLLNRVLAAARLRFYGHAAEAALSPTYPKNALGQCWSFEDAKGGDDDEEEDGVRGRYATLTVNLPRAVRFTSVALEHPPNDLSPTPGTAVRDFRVIGYEGADGEGQPLHLGSFRYSIDSQRPLQEFDVSGDDLVPRMRSVTLAIDSNWGAPYSCLYRFRVHGA